MILLSAKIDTYRISDLSQSIKLKKTTHATLKEENDMMIKITINNMIGSNTSKLCNNVDDVFDCILAITNDVELTMDVQGWNDLATVGETYDGDRFTATCEA